MSKKRSSPQKREREFQKRQREKKKADKAAEKRERRLSRGQQSTPTVAMGEDGNPGEEVDLARHEDPVNLDDPASGATPPEPGGDSPDAVPARPPDE